MFLIIINAISHDDDDYYMHNKYMIKYKQILPPAYSFGAVTFSGLYVYYPAIYYTCFPDSSSAVEVFNAITALACIAWSSQNEEVCVFEYDDIDSQIVSLDALGHLRPHF